MFVFIEARIKDDRKFQEYLAGHLPAIQKYGGQIVARTRSPYIAMGERHSDVFVIQEWPDRRAFSDWYESEDYTRWIPVRDAGCELRIIVFD
jgi:uncharacterized protein (DUF1330 family)